MRYFVLVEGVENMSNQMIERSNARKGLVVDEDIFANSLFPIIRKDTTLTNEHLEVLEIFAIKEFMVKVEAVVEKEEVEIDTMESEKISSPQIIEKSLEEHYEEAVQNIKKEYMKWRAGITPDVAQVRSIIVPLLEQAEKPGLDLSFLTKVATEKDYLYHHSVAISLLSYVIAKKMKLTTGEAVQLGVAGSLIDCGMVKVPPTVVGKTHRLTDQDHIEIKKHPIYSYQMVKNTPLLKTEMKMAIFQHHERLDGSGYPKQEKGKKISIYAQIFSIADVYHARTSDRIYRSKESPYKVLESFRENYEKFNLQAINALYEAVGNLSIRTKVELSNGKTGSIIYLHPDEPFRPTVKLLEDDSIIDLKQNRQLTVKRIID